MQTCITFSETLFILYIKEKWVWYNIELEKGKKKKLEYKFVEDPIFNVFLTLFQNERYFFAYWILRMEYEMKNIVLGFVIYWLIFQSSPIQTGEHIAFRYTVR